MSDGLLIIGLVVVFAFSARELWVSISTRKIKIGGSIITQADTTTIFYIFQLMHAFVLLIVPFLVWDLFRDFLR